MAFLSTAIDDDLNRASGLADSVADDRTASSSAVSWGAIIAGAAAAASLSLILLILGVGLGLSSVSPWASAGVSATTFGLSTILWLTLTQLLASSLGGYLAGRLRIKWTDAHTDEVYFRDTAHGFLAWAIASLATAALLGSAIGSILGGGVQAGVAGMTGPAVGSAGASMDPMQGNESGPMAYFVDSLFRRDATAIPGTGTAEPASGQDTAEVSRIFMNVGRSESLPPDDIGYVGQLVARRTGLSRQEAEKLVVAFHAKAQAKLRDAEMAAREAADLARKASAYSAIWLFVSLLVGAFVASLAATFGGRLRDA